MMKILTTPRLTIRNYQLDDRQALYTMIRGYQASGMAVYDEPWPTDAGEYKGIAEYLAGADTFLVVCLKSGAYIGHITLNMESHDVYNLGYIFDAEYHGRGYATEACRAVIKRTFQELGAEKIVSGTAAINTPSVRLLTRLGLRKTGEFPISFQQDAEGKPIEFTGCSWEMKREEWRESHI